MTTCAPHILSLMQNYKLAWNWTLEPEQRLTIECADYLRALTIEGKLKAIWCHCPNEGKRHKIVGQIMRRMGMLPGSPDFWFAWKDGSGVMELKVKPNPMQPSQKNYVAWAGDRGVHHAVIYSLEQFKATLQDWGLVQDALPQAQDRDALINAQGAQTLGFINYPSMEGA